MEKRLAHEMGRCIADFELVAPGDRVMVAISGGKDSYTLLHLLERARQRAPVEFEIIAVHLDQGQPGYDGKALEAWLRDRGYEHRIVREDTYRLVTERIPEGIAVLGELIRERLSEGPSAAVDSRAEAMPIF